MKSPLMALIASLWFSFSYSQNFTGLDYRDRIKVESDSLIFYRIKGQSTEDIFRGAKNVSFEVGSFVKYNLGAYLSKNYLNLLSYKAYISGPYLSIEFLSADADCGYSTTIETTDTSTEHFLAKTFILDGDKNRVKCLEFTFPSKMLAKPSREIALDGDIDVNYVKAKVEGSGSKGKVLHDDYLQSNIKIYSKDNEIYFDISIENWLTEKSNRVSEIFVEWDNETREEKIVLIAGIGTRKYTLVVNRSRLDEFGVIFNDEVTKSQSTYFRLSGAEVNNKAQNALGKNPILKAFGEDELKKMAMVRIKTPIDLDLMANTLGIDRRQLGRWNYDYYDFCDTYKPGATYNLRIPREKLNDFIEKKDHLERQSSKLRQ